MCVEAAGAREAAAVAVEVAEAVAAAVAVVVNSKHEIKHIERET